MIDEYRRSQKVRSEALRRIREWLPTLALSSTRSGGSVTWDEATASSQGALESLSASSRLLMHAILELEVLAEVSRDYRPPITCGCQVLEFELRRLLVHPARDEVLDELDALMTGIGTEDGMGERVRHGLNAMRTGFDTLYSHQVLLQGLRVGMRAGSSPVKAFMNRTFEVSLQRAIVEPWFENRLQEVRHHYRNVATHDDKALFSEESYRRFCELTIGSRGFREWLRSPVANAERRGLLDALLAGSRRARRSVPRLGDLVSELVRVAARWRPAATLTLDHELVEEVRMRDSVMEDHGLSMRLGDRYALRVRTGQDGYLCVLNIGTSGSLSWMYPSKYQPGGLTRGGASVRIPPKSAFRLTGTPGREVVLALLFDEVSRPESLRFAGHARPLIDAQFLSDLVGVLLASSAEDVGVAMLMFDVKE